MLTEEQLEEIFATLSEKHSVYLNSEEGRVAFEAFKRAIQNMNQPSERFYEIEMAGALIARGSDVNVAHSEIMTPLFLNRLTESLKSVKGLLSDAQAICSDVLFSIDVVAQLSEHLNKKNKKNKPNELNKQIQEELDGFTVILQNLLVQSSRAIFLTQAEKEARCLKVGQEEVFKLITLVAYPNSFGQFKTIVTKLEDAFNKDPQLKTAIESALKACNTEVSLGDPKRQENLRELIQRTLNENQSLLYILQHLNIVSTQRFADMKTKDLSFRFFKKEVLSEDYRTLLEKKGITPFDNKDHFNQFTQYFLDHFVPAATYAAAVTIEKIISLKEQEYIPEALNIKKTNGKAKYELRRLDITPVDANNPQHWLCYHLGDAVNCCLRAGREAERCIIDGLTQCTSGFYIVTEKKSTGGAKEKICAAIYAFISEK